MRVMNYKMDLTCLSVNGESLEIAFTVSFSEQKKFVLKN